MKTLFNFTKGEQRGIIVLTILLAIILLLNFFITKPDTTPTATEHVIAWEQEVQAFENQRNMLSARYDSMREAQKLEREERYQKYDEKTFTHEPSQPAEIDYFFFDPNSISVSDLTRLGFSQKQAEAIERYRVRGGIFKEKDDFSKVFVVSEEMYARLEPWIVISPVTSVAATSDSVEEETTATPIFLILELNSCDTTQLMQLKGIGKVLSQKIVNQRDKLGGFYSVEQLTDINGISKELFEELQPHFTVDASFVKKIDLNKATFKQLLQHPYFEYHIVKNIFNFKDKNGNFQSVEQLKEVPLMYEDLWLKIAPYLTVKN